MSYKHHIIGFSLVLTATQGFTDDSDTKEAENSTARAYRAHLISFLWSQSMSSETLEYDNIYQVDKIQRFDYSHINLQASKQIETPLTDTAEEVNPFSQYQILLEKKVNILSNQTWPIVFQDRGSIAEFDFHSTPLLDGYPELNGQIHIKLGRYLETQIQYQHYLFDTFTKPAAPIQKNNLIFDELDPFFIEDETTNTPPVKLYEPALVLNIDLERKTASKKLNYIDHPLVGSLLYFEPISVAQAEHEIMLQELNEEEMLRDAETSISLDPTDEMNAFEISTFGTDTSEIQTGSPVEPSAPAPLAPAVSTPTQESL